MFFPLFLVMRTIDSAGSYPGLGEPLDVLRLGVSDEIVVEDHIRLQTQHLASHWQQEQPRVVVGEVVAEQSGVFKMHWLSGETGI